MLIREGPKHRKTVARPNAKHLWEVVGVPELRIVGDDLWDAVRARQHEQAYALRRDETGNPLNRAHRQKFLLSGLLKCGLCGGGFTIVAQDRYGCATRRSRGTCDNTATIVRQEIETRVLRGLKERLLAPELVREFTQTFQEEVNRAAAEREQQSGARRQQLATVERKIAGIVSAIKDGGYSRVLSDRLVALEREKETLAALLIGDAPQVVRIHPRLADIHVDKVAQLEISLNDPAIRGEAGQLLRSLISRIALMPREGGGVNTVLHGETARILAFCDASERKSKLPKALASGV